MSSWIKPFGTFLLSTSIAAGSASRIGDQESPPRAKPTVVQTVGGEEERPAIVHAKPNTQAKDPIERDAWPINRSLSAPRDLATPIPITNPEDLVSLEFLNQFCKDYCNSRGTQLLDDKATLISMLLTTSPSIRKNITDISEAPQLVKILRHTKKYAGDFRDATEFNKAIDLLVITVKDASTNANDRKMIIKIVAWWLKYSNHRDTTSHINEVVSKLSPPFEGKLALKPRQLRFGDAKPIPRESPTPSTTAP